MITTRTAPFLFVLSSLVLLASCGEEQQSAHAPDPAQATTASWRLKEAPDGAQSVTQAKASASEGDRVVIRGRIGGRKAPMSDSSPVFTLIDLALPYCGQLAEDGCPTPWDYCCETPETISGNAATIQVVDADGSPIDPAALAESLSPLDELIVTGVVAPRPNETVLTVKASGVYRVN